MTSQKDSALPDTAVAYSRGLVGALLIGMPTLMTMEMWWGGFTIPPQRILLLLGVNFGVLLILQHYSGLHPEKTMRAQLRAAIVAAGLGIVVSTAMLLVIGVLRHDTVFRDVIAKVALQSVPVSIGASIASTHFDDQSKEAERRRDGTEGGGSFFPSLAVGLAGAVVFGFNLGATEEPMIIGEQLTWMHALAVVAVSLVIVFGVSYAVGRRRLGIDPFSRAWVGFFVREAVATYAIALLVAAYLLWTFGRVDADTGLSPAVHMVLALGVVTTLGATAGELLI